MGAETAHKQTPIYMIMCFILVSLNECFVSSFVHDTKRDSQEDCLFAEYLFEKVYRTMMSLYFKQLEEHED